MKTNSTHRRKPIKVIKVLGMVIIILLACFVVLMLIWGNYRRNYCEGRSPDWLTDGPIAHRGLCDADNIDENSIGAFRRAIDSGYAIELDLRYTKDMVPMVIHDNDLNRLFGVDAKLSSLSFDEAKELSYLKSGERLASLEDVLALVNGQVPLLIEIKAYHIPGKFEENIVEILKEYTGPFAIQSYNPLALNAVKKIAPEIPVGLLLNDFPGIPVLKSARILKDNAFCALCRPAFITYNSDLLEIGELDTIRNSGTVVLGFLFNESDITNSSYQEKVDNIIFGEVTDE